MPGKRPTTALFGLAALIALAGLFGVAGIVGVVGVIPVALGDVQLVLTNGQVIRGLDARRDGNNFIVDMPGGTALTLPTQTVAEVRLEGEPPPPPPPQQGMVQAPPETIGGPPAPGPTPGVTVAPGVNLAGPPIQAPTPAQQTAVFGKPSEFQQMPRNDTWTPTPSWDPNVNVMADSETKWKQMPRNDTWTPTSAYDPNVNVMAQGQTKWQQSPRNDTWTPTDGFAKTPTGYIASVKRQPTAAAASGRPAGVTGPRPNAWACGERFFVPGETSLKHGAGLAQSVQVHAVTDARYDALAVPLYSADSTVHGVSRRAVFTMAGGSCKLLGGDLGPVLGTGFTLDQSVAQSASSFSSLLGATGIDPLKGNADRLAYAFALVSLADPDVSGAGGSRLTLLYDAADLSRIAAASTGRCAQAAGKRRKDLEKAAGRIAIPRIDATAQGDTVTFWTWSQAGGTVYVNTVFLGRDGGVSIHRETVASHIGAHAEAPQQADAGRPARTS